MRRSLLALPTSALVLSLLGVACSGTPAPESTSSTEEALGIAARPPLPHPGAHPGAHPGVHPGAHPGAHQGAPYPKLNEVFQKNVHNAYWTNVHGSPDDPFAAGPRMRIWDMMLHEHVRSLEWDLHDDVDDPYSGRGKHPGEYRIYHTNEPDNSTCFTLADCLQLLQRLDYVLPQHEVVHIALELKQVDKLLQDDGLFDDSDFKPEEIDRVLWEHLGSKIYTPAEFLSRCAPGATMRQCAASQGWPTIDELRGRYIFTVHGTETGGSSGATNERAWWRYAGVDIRSRTAFPMYVVSDDVTDVARPRERALHYNTTTADFMNMWRRALDNTIVFDLENPGNRDFAPTDPKTVPLNVQLNAIVRPAAAHLIDAPVPSNGLEDDVGRLRQRDVVAAGWQWLMTDYPVNFISDAQFDDPNPLKLPTRVSRPFFTKADVVSGRTGATIPQPPTWGEPLLVEPAGSRLYFDTTNRITKMDLTSASGAPVQRDPDHRTSAQALMTAPDAAVQAVQDWEVFPATSMIGHGGGPLETTPFGNGCFTASSDPSASPSAATLIVCRSVGHDDARSVAIGVAVHEVGRPAIDQDLAVPFHIVQGASGGDAIRVRLERTGATTVARVFTAAEMTPDGAPLWVPWSTPAFTVNADLRYQGLVQHGDGVFTGTRLNGQPVSLSQLTLGPKDHYVYDLSWCGDGSCRGPQLPSHETFFTAASDNAQYVGVHETEGAVYDGQWRTLYTTDRYELSSSGLGQLPRENKLLLRRTAGSDATWTPLYECIDWTRDVHTYWLDTDGTCPNDKGPRGKSAGVMGYIASRPLPNTVPLFHMRKGTHNATNVDTHDHYFALGDAERAVKTTGEGYELVKRVGWVYTPDTLNAPVCVPRTTCINGASCGTQDDGCGTGEISCGRCSSGNVCDINRCIPASSKAGCHATCAAAREGCVESGDPQLIKHCTATYQACIAACDAPACVPRTCAAAGATCGSVSDGCGGTINCGACACTPSCAGKRCGGSDGCGHSCPGTCAKIGFVCNQDEDGLRFCGPPG